MTSSASTIDRALALAARGYRVFPVKGKIPAIPGGRGCHDATTDAAQITAWWTENTGAGIGLACGDGLVAFDGDTYKPDFPVEDWNDIRALLDAAPTQATPSGGAHIFARIPAGVDSTSNNDALGKGIDRKAKGGYVVDYGVDLPQVDELPEAPRSLCTLRLTKANGDTSKTITSRHDATLAALHGAKTPQAIRRVLEGDAAAGIIERSGVNGLHEIARMLPEGEDDSPRIYLIDPHDHAAVTDPKVGVVPWAVEGWLPVGQFVLLAGGWKTGKSLTTYSAMLDAALGRPVFGLFDVNVERFQIWQFEMPTREHDRRVRKQALGGGGVEGPAQAIEAQASGRLSAYVKPRFTLDTPEGLATFHACVRRSDAEVVLLDSIGAAFTNEGSVSNNSLVRQQVEDAFGPLLEHGVTIIGQTHKRKSQGGRTDADRDSIIGAQSWAAAAGLIYTMDRVGEKTLSDFWIEARCLGGWVHGAADKIALHVYDDQVGVNPGLRVEPGKPEDDGVERTQNKTEAAAWTAVRLVEASAKPLQRKQVLEALEEDGVTAGTAKRGLDKALERKMLRPDKDGRKTYIRLGTRAS